MSSTRQNVGRVAALERHRGPDHPLTLSARQDLAESVIELRIREQVAKAPALRAEQIERLRALLGGAS